MPVYNNILETIGRTPAVRLNRLAPEGIELYVKVEAANPMGSVKDRLALGVIEEAERSGRLRPGQTVIEATSGNTGIGLAMVCAQKGYPLVVVMAENFSVERRKLMRFLGAKIVLTPAAEKGSGMLAKAVELAEKHDWFLCQQFENEANADVHSRTTAREIVEDFETIGLDYWVTGFGTGGTLKGVSRVLKDKLPDTKVVVCEPDNSQLLGSGIPQPREVVDGVTTSHPNFRPHLMQGWSPDFVAKLTEDALKEQWIDRIVPVGGQRALECSRELASQEGIFTGISGGATLAGALRLCEQIEPGSKVLCMLPDTGERYLSTTLFEDIAVDMTEDEVAISKSTPRFRFDRPSPPPPKPTNTPVAAPTICPEADDYVQTVINDTDQPVVMFSLEWCEFCWSVRRMFKELGIPYRSIDLDSVAYQDGNWGGRVRTALNARTGMATIPQIFVGGELIGGCTETFDAYEGRTLQPRFAALGIETTATPGFEPYSFLPKWLQTR